MTEVYRFGSTVKWRVDFTDDLGEPVTATSARYVVVSDKGEVLAGPIDLDVSATPGYVEIEIPASLNQPVDAEPRGFRMVSLEFADSAGRERSVSLTYVLEKDFLVEAGVNSFGAFGELIVVSMDLPHLMRFHGSSPSQKQAALIGAWHAIGKLELRFDCKETVRAEDLDAEDLAQLSAPALLALRRAQIIEANNLLGGNPVEERRKAGLISHSAGESTHFFRTSKPLDLPICREAMEALKGYVVWGITIGRS